MDPTEIKVMPLRSSDDSMTLYMGANSEVLKNCVLQHRLNLGVLGINLSSAKTFFFPQGIEEYKSLYMDGSFVPIWS